MALTDDVMDAVNVVGGVKAVGRKLGVQEAFVEEWMAKGTMKSAIVVRQNLIRADGHAGELPGRANAVDFEPGKRRRDGYTALFLSRSTRR
jgi:hypothetical protein